MLSPRRSDLPFIDENGNPVGGKGETDFTNSPRSQSRKSTRSKDSHTHHQHRHNSQELTPEKLRIAFKKAQQYINGVPDSPTLWDHQADDFSPASPGGGLPSSSLSTYDEYNKSNSGFSSSNKTFSPFIIQRAEPTTATETGASSPQRQQQPFEVVDKNGNYSPKLLARAEQNNDNNINNNNKPEEQQEQENYFPDVNTLLENCESYMNWIENKCPENLQHLIQSQESKHIFPNEKFDREETLKWFNLEHIAKLGAICYFNLELNKFFEARAYVIKARDFIQSCAERGLLFKAYIASCDYVWDYLCLYGSIKEWQYTGVMELFPEMNLLSLTLHYHKLEPKVRAGVFCLKSYFLELQKNRVDDQLNTLRQAISWDPQYFEWFICLQEALRYQRNKSQGYSLTYPWDAEIQAVYTAASLSYNHPRSILQGIHLLAEITKAQLAEPRWTIIRFGDINFHGLLEVKNFMKDQGEQLVKLAPKSVRINTKLAQIFTSILPYGHREFKLGRESLERCLKYHPDSCKANHRMADFYLNVDTNFRRAEMYYHLALDSNEKSFTSLTAILLIMLRNAEHRKSEIFGLLDSQLQSKVWDWKQIATLHYLRGITHLATFKNRDAIKSFVTAYSIHDKALPFEDLPALHRRYGWPGWPSTSKLTFANIREQLQNERAGATATDSTKKRMISEILKLVNSADATGRRLRLQRHSWRH